MNKCLVCLAVCFAGLVWSNPLAAEDVDDIKGVIAKETKSFYQRDAEGWKSCWAHSADVSRTLASSRTYTAMVGWEKFGPAIVQMIEQNPDPAPVKFENGNHNIHASDELAWVEYDQTMTIVGNSDFRRHSREHRVLKKIDGQWKIVSQITHDLPWPEQPGQ